MARWPAGSFEGGGSSRSIVHARGIGLKSGFRVTPEVGMYRACEIKIQIDNCVFEVPLLGPGMRGLCRELRFGGVSPNTAAFATLLARDRFLVFIDVRK